MIREERTGWRDEGISKRHREWGFNCPGVDIDFLLCEYDGGQPKAIVEYKHENANVDLDKLTNIGSAPQSYKALRILADNSKIPFLVVVYPSDFSWFRIYPINDYALKYVKEVSVYSELRYISLLYKIRGRPIPKDIIEKIYLKYYKPIEENIKLVSFIR